jgi:hypothetical protein
MLQQSIFAFTDEAAKMTFDVGAIRRRLPQRSGRTCIWEGDKIRLQVADSAFRLGRHAFIGLAIAIHNARHVRVFLLNPCSVRLLKQGD